MVNYLIPINIEMWGKHATEETALKGAKEMKKRAEIEFPELSFELADYWPADENRAVDPTGRVQRFMSDNWYDVLSITKPITPEMLESEIAERIAKNDSLPLDEQCENEYTISLLQLALGK